MEIVLNTPNTIPSEILENIFEYIHAIKHFPYEIILLVCKNWNLSFKKIVRVIIFDHSDGFFGKPTPDFYLFHSVGHMYNDIFYRFSHMDGYINNCFRFIKESFPYLKQSSFNLFKEYYNLQEMSLKIIDKYFIENKRVNTLAIYNDFHYKQIDKPECLSKLKHVILFGPKFYDLLSLQFFLNDLSSITSLKLDSILINGDNDIFKFNELDVNHLKNLKSIRIKNCRIKITNLTNGIQKIKMDIQHFKIEKDSSTVDLSKCLDLMSLNLKKRYKFGFVLFYVYINNPIRLIELRLDNGVVLYDEKMRKKIDLHLPIRYESICYQDPYYVLLFNRLKILNLKNNIEKNQNSFNFMTSLLCNLNTLNLIGCAYFIDLMPLKNIPILKTIYINGCLFFDEKNIKIINGLSECLMYCFEKNKKYNISHNKEKLYFIKCNECVKMSSQSLVSKILSK